MSFRDRGITVGDLVIITIIILSTTFLFRTFHKDRKTTLDLGNKDRILDKKNLLPKIQMNNLSL